MSCSYIALETKYGRARGKCAHYRAEFPDSACEHEAVSEHSPKPLADSEILMRTLVREHQIDRNGRLKPAGCRPELSTRGFPWAVYSN